MTEEELAQIEDQVRYDVRQKDGWQTTADSAVPMLIAEVRRLREAISRVLADDESAPGGWGPDVTTVAFLRQALEGE